MKKNLLIAVTCLAFLTFCSTQKESNQEEVSEKQVVEDINKELEATSNEVKKMSQEKLNEIDTLIEKL